MLTRFPQATFTRGKLARFAGLTDDLAAHWVKEGLLVSVDEGQGAGTHKEFTVFQVNKAAILSFLRKMGCNIASLRWFAETLERGWEIASKYPGVTHKDLWQGASLAYGFKKFEVGEAKVFNPDYSSSKAGSEPSRILAQSREEVIEGFLLGDERSEYGVQIAEEIYKSPYDHLAIELAADLYNEELLSDRNGEQAAWLAWPSGEGWRVFSAGDAKNLSGLDEPIDGGILIVVGRLIQKVWNR